MHRQKSTAKFVICMHMETNRGDSKCNAEHLLHLNWNQREIVKFLYNVGLIHNFCGASNQKQVSSSNAMGQDRLRRIYDDVYAVGRSVTNIDEIKDACAPVGGKSAYRNPLHRISIPRSRK